LSIFREKIAGYQEKNIKRISGKIEINESYFDSRHKGYIKRRIDRKEISVDGIFKRNG